MYGNMIRHLNCTHPKAYMQFRKWKKFSEWKALGDRKNEKSEKAKKMGLLWKFFEEAGDGWSKCNLCNSTMRRYKVQHLEKYHPEVFKQHEDVRDITYGNNSHTKDKPSNPRSTRLGWIKRFLKRLDNKRCECTVCHKVLRMPPDDHSNLKRHVRKKHPFYYEQEVKAYKDVQKMCKKDESEEFEVIEYLVEDIDSDDPLLASDTFINEIEPDETNIIDPDITDAETDIESTIGEVSNKSDEPKPIKPVNVESLDETDPDIEEKIKQLCVKNVAGARYRHKTCFWNFFISMNDYNLYKCIFCHRDIVIFPKSVSNLKRHMAHVHPTQYELIIKHAPYYDTCSINKHTTKEVIVDGPNKTVFDVLDNGGYQCKDCNKIISCDDNLQILTKHVEEAHGEKLDSQTVPTIVVGSGFVFGSEEQHEL